MRLFAKVTAGWYIMSAGPVLIVNPTIIYKQRYDHGKRKKVKDVEGHDTCPYF